MKKLNKIKRGRPNVQIKLNCKFCNKEIFLHPSTLKKKLPLCSKICRIGFRKLEKDKLKCSIGGCVRKYDKKGYCGFHYHKLRKYGNPLIVIPRGSPRKLKFKKICVNCQKEFGVPPSRNNERKKFCSKKCLHEYLPNYIPKPKTFEEAKWYIIKNGYIAKIIDKKIIWQHRWVMEQFLNRPLLKDEVVHHINGIKNDNRLENLIVYNKSQHSKKHKEIFYDYLKLKKENEELKKLILN